MFSLSRRGVVLRRRCLGCKGLSLGLTQMCSYEHHNIEEPAILLGGAFVVEAEEARE